MAERVVCGPFKWAGLRGGLTLIKYLTGQLKREEGLFWLMVSGNMVHYGRDGVASWFYLWMVGTYSLFTLWLTRKEIRLRTWAGSCSRL